MYKLFAPVLLAVSLVTPTFGLSVGRRDLISEILSLIDGTLCPDVPSHVNFKPVSSLPDPFLMLDDQRIISTAQWPCRRNELNQLIQRDELGLLPDKPKVTSSFTDGNLTVNATVDEKTISFVVPITLPEGDGPFPAIIGFDGGSIPHPDGVAWLDFDDDDIAQQNDQTSRGVGKFYDLFGTNSSAGALMAWSWAVSRIIDALETTPETKINTNKIGVTGCSRDGKGALVAGAFDQRIALTISQESGSGGSASWRISDFMFAWGDDTQTAHEIVQENVWLSTNFDAFVNDTATLPFDHHSLQALVAPRGLLVIDNPSNEWLGPMSTYGCSDATKATFKALGVGENYGFTAVGNHTHCDFPASQQPALDAFINKFLFDNQTADTDIFFSDTTYVNYTRSQWITWPTNALLSI